jgi:hypothetical protein
MKANMTQESGANQQLHSDASGTSLATGVVTSISEHKEHARY